MLYLTTRSTHFYMVILEEEDEKEFVILDQKQKSENARCITVVVSAQCSNN